ncbi:UPF0481 protein [Trifolium repens]|nr:UPF0481 protein [Trifolium repens]
MEEVKLRCFLSLLHRAGKKGESVDFLKRCGKAIWTSEEEIRASYVYDKSGIKLEKQELANIMLIDGCFLLELLIAKDMDSKFHCRLEQISPAHQVLKDEDVLSDIILLENQIPILVLHKLSQTLFPGEFNENDPKDTAKKINKLFLSILGYSHSNDINPSYFKAPHVLDIVYYFVNSTMKGGRESVRDPVDHCAVSFNGTLQDPLPKLKHCATRLQARGVNIKLAQETRSAISFLSFIWNCFRGLFIKFDNMPVTIDNQVHATAKEVKGLDFYFKFEKGNLEIAQLEITKTTKAKWLNVIAWEHHKNNWKFYNTESKDHDQIKTSSLTRKFTSAALIFDGLICCSDDVKLLKEKNIIVDNLKMTNMEIHKFFHEISLGIDRGIVDSSYVNTLNELNKYSTAFYILRIMKIFWHRCKCDLEWLWTFLKRNYNLVAAMLAFLSLLQSVYAVLSFYLRK